MREKSVRKKIMKGKEEGRALDTWRKGWVLVTSRSIEHCREVCCFFPLYFFYTYFIIQYSSRLSSRAGPTSLSDNSCSWAARGGGGDW
jgi:hypothetical protein